MQTEVRGERFYRQAMLKAEREEAKDLFKYLAEQEVHHKELFEGLSSQIVFTEIDPATWEEAIGYIVATVDRAFFADDAPIRAIPVGDTLEQMIRQAIGFEKQTLLFFYGLRDIVRPANQPIIDQIIDEEKGHVRRLSAMLNPER